jgi:hypothetical protein
LSGYGKCFIAVRYGEPEGSKRNQERRGPRRSTLILLDLEAGCTTCRISNNTHKDRHETME